MVEKQTTLEDVARVARVSTATVSRCLSDEGIVRPETRQRVMAAIARLGYTPNFGARVLAARRTRMIGAIIPTMENAIFAIGIQAFQEALADADYTLLVSSSSYKRDLEEEQINNLVSRGADALLLIGEDRNPNLYSFLNRRGIPYVLAWNYRKRSPHCFVGFNNRLAAGDAADKVIALSHRRIGVIAGLTRHNDRARDRLAGFRNSFENHGISVGETPVLEVPYSISLAGDAFQALIESHPQTTAVLCGNDVLAVGAVLRARKMGIEVPGQISVVGFDDIEIAKIVSPPLTTVQVPHRQMGRHSARLLVKCLEEKSTPSSIELKPRFVLRGSLKPPHS